MNDLCKNWDYCGCSGLKESGGDRIRRTGGGMV